MEDREITQKLIADLESIKAQAEAVHMLWSATGAPAYGSSQYQKFEELMVQYRDLLKQLFPFDQAMVQSAFEAASQEIAWLTAWVTAFPPTHVDWEANWWRLDRLLHQKEMMEFVLK